MRCAVTPDWAQGEPAKPVGRDNFDHLQPGQVFDDVRLPRQGAVFCDAAEFPQAEHDAISSLDMQSLGQRLVQHDLPPLRDRLRSHRPFAQLPKLLVAAHYHDLVGAIHVIARCRMFQAGLRQQKDRLGAGVAGQFRLPLARPRGEILAEVMVRQQDLIDSSQSFDGQAAQTAANRVSHDQGTGQHGGRDQYPQQDRQVHAAVVPQTLQGITEGAKFFRRTHGWPSFGSTSIHGLLEKALHQLTTDLQPSRQRKAMGDDDQHGG